MAPSGRPGVIFAAPLAGAIQAFVGVMCSRAVHGEGVVRWN